jgi:hypothetical protein
LTPNTGSFTSLTLSATFTDANGYQDLRSVYVLVNAGLSGANACFLRYDPVPQTLRLADNAGSTFPYSMQTGGAGIQNSQCRIAAFSVTGSGTTLTLNASVSFFNAFAGRKDIYLTEEDSTAIPQQWVSRGSWVVLGSGSDPTIYMDTPSGTVNGSVNVSGWAIDSATRPETAINRVEIYIDGVKQPGTASYGSSRADVCGTYPDRPGCPNVGFSYVWNTTTVANGSHTVRSTASTRKAVLDSWTGW